MGSQLELGRRRELWLVVVCVEAELAGTRDVLAGVVQLGTLLQQLLLERSTTPRQTDLVVAFFSQAGAIATARLHLAALDLAGLAVPAAIPASPSDLAASDWSTRHFVYVNV